MRLMKRIIIFASGSGTNAENIIKYFENNANITVVKVLTNNEHAKIIDKCKRLKIKCLIFKKKELLLENTILNLLKEEADYIILAGFLLKIPNKIVQVFHDKIINIHPALLPKYGGKGMYGMNVHRAVVENREKESGITIHYVNENYDEGAIIFQKSVRIIKKDTPENVAAKVQALEYKYFPKTIEKVILKENA